MVCHRLKLRGGRREMRRSLPQTQAHEDALLRLPAVIRKQLLGHTHTHTQRETHAEEREGERKWETLRGMRGGKTNLNQIGLQFTEGWAEREDDRDGERDGCLRRKEEIKEGWSLKSRLPRQQWQKKSDKKLQRATQILCIYHLFFISCSRL